MPLLRAIENDNEVEVRQILARLVTEPRNLLSQMEINEGLKLAVTCRRNFSIIELLLNASPDRNLIEYIFDDLVQEGTTPFTIKLLQKYISQEKYVQASRQHARSRYGNYYMVDMLEEDNFVSVKQSMEKRFQSKSRQKGVVNRLLDQSYMNDLLIEETHRDHRYTVQYLLNHTDSYPYPDSFTVSQALGRCLLHHNFSLASMLLQNHEGVYCPVRVNQNELDQHFHFAMANTDVETVEWLLLSHNMMVSLGVVEHYYEVFSNHNSNAFPPALRRNRSNKQHEQEQVRHYVLGLLERLVSDEFKSELIRRRERRQRVQRQLQALNHTNANDIHAFSRTTIGQSDEVNNRQTLNEAIKSYLTSNTPPVSPAHISQALETVLEHLQQLFPGNSQQYHAAENILSEGLSREALDLLGLTVTYLQSRHSSEKILLWLQGFLVESVEMRSCNPGIVERIVTGLRGVGDEHLDKIFKQVEGPLLAGYFLTNHFNIIYQSEQDSDFPIKLNRARVLASLFYSKGCREGINDVDIVAIVKDFALGRIAEYVSNIESFSVNVEAVAEIVLDCFDMYIKPHLVQLCVENENQSSNT